MTLERSSWFHLAKDLPLGRKTRVDHDCGPGRTLVISRDGEGYRAWCFRCNAGDRAPPPEMSAADRIEAMQRAVKAQAEDDKLRAALTPPEPRVYTLADWPEPARLWLYRAGLSAPMIRRLGAYYHPASDRVVLPLYDGGRLVFWQARDASWTRASTRPKYMAPEVDKTRLAPTFGSGTPVLVEDILSAFKVAESEAGMGCVLLGTSLNRAMLAKLMQQRLPVLVWLDPDPAGQTATTKIVKQLRAYGVPCHIIRSDHDPKVLFLPDIHHIIEVSCPST